MTEHLVGRQGQPRGAQVHAIQLSNRIGLQLGSTPSDHLAALHAAELPWVGPAFLPGAQSLLQVMTQHFCYTAGEPAGEIWSGLGTAAELKF